MFALNSARTQLATCDPGCLECSNANPKICVNCADSFYLLVGPGASIGVCNPCDPLSNCRRCYSDVPAKCISCYSGNSLSVDNACVACLSSCYTCDNTNSTACTSCSSGLILVDSACVAQDPKICSLFCASCSSKNGNYSCDICNPGSTLLNGQCVPCLAGCNVCSN